MSRAKRHTTGRASDYFVHFKKLLRSGSSLRIVLYCRVSRCWQKKKGNLNDQESYLRRRIRIYEKKYGVKIEVVAVFEETASGWYNDRIHLERAALKAKDCNAVLVAESSCRFLRSRRYHSYDRPDVLPTTYEYVSLMRDTDGATLATIQRPDRYWKRVKAYQAKRGQHSKNKRGGRPKINKPGYKKERREMYLNDVLKLYDEGYSKAEIVRKTGIARSTIVDWIQKY